MRYVKITLIFVATCCLVFVAASVTVVQFADLFGVADWLGDADNETFHFNFAASLALMVVAITCAAYTARKCSRQSRNEDLGDRAAPRGRALAIVQDDERQVTFRVPREDRVWGMVLMAFGLATCLLLVFGVLPSKADDSQMAGIIVCIILGGLFLVIGCQMGLRVDEIQFDPLEHSYTCRLGFPWSARRWEGAIDEISRLEMIGEEEDTGDFKATVWRVGLIWHDVTRQPIALTEFTHRFSTLGQDRRQLALDAMLDVASRINVQAYDQRGNRLTADPSPSNS
jgi:hypothetical protein